MSAGRRRPLRGGRAAGLVFGLFVAGGLVIIFGGTLARSTDVEAEAARLRAEVQLLEARVAAGEAEIEFLEGEAFLLQQARQEGYGERGETAFALPPDAPSPAPLPSIGSGARGETRRAPFDAWMALLFGE